jgi:hypothetical protein
MTKILFETDKIENKIFCVRGKKIIIDRDLAVMHGVSTKRLNEQVKRNRRRFPDDFMFRLTMEKPKNWSQIATGLRFSNILQV